MAKNYGNERLGGTSNDEEEEEEGEEALSLCDLPNDYLRKENQSRNEGGQEEEEEEQVAKSIEEKEEEDFNFGSWGGSVLTESEMCVADEVFFQGQILPLRLSVSSDSALNRSRHDSRCNSRSESMDQRCCYSSGGFSSRSSSCRSHISSSSTNSTSTATNYNSYTRSKFRNQFHTHPSPKPQIRVPTIRHGNAGIGGGRRQKSSIWEFFRVGLVRTPEIELQNLKLRTQNNNNNNNNKSFGSRSNSIGSNNSSISDDLKSKKQRFFEKDGSFFGGCHCKCSVDAVETVSSRIVIMKSKNSGSRNNESESETEVMKEKLLQIKQEIKKQGKQGKQGMSHQHRHHHNRTFEWLKELSIEGGGLDNA